MIDPTPGRGRRHLAVAVAVLATAACASREPTNPAQQAAVAACRSRADEVFQRQNRYLLSLHGNMDAPLSSSDPDPDKSVGTVALAGRYDRDQLVSDCARGTGAPPVAGNLPAANDATEEPPTR